jgi:hypothetical protein
MPRWEDCYSRLPVPRLRVPVSPPGGGRGGPLLFLFLFLVPRQYHFSSRTSMAGFFATMALNFSTSLSPFWPR